MIKKVLVTGGCGFIGSHLVDLLVSQGFSVRIIDNLSTGHLGNINEHIETSAVELLDEDICNISSNNNFFKQVDWVFHLAGLGDIIPSIEEPARYFHTNTQGTVQVLEAARNNNVKKFVYAASSSCYGLAATPTNEHHDIDPLYPYAMSKYLGERAVFHWNNVYGMEVNSICIFNAYGPRVRTKGAYGAVFGVFFKQKQSGFPLTIVGDGYQTRDFVHVVDVARAFLLAASESVTGERFNIGAGNPKSILELADIIGGEKEFIPDRPGEPRHTFADISKAQKYLSWYPKIDFLEGVSDMLKDINLWSEAPLWTSESISKETKNWFRFMGNKWN